MATGSCKQCGRPMDEHSGGCSNGCFGGWVHEFCSEGCRDAYNKAQAAERKAQAAKRIEHVKKRGEKMLKKWQKDVSKKEAKIKKLENALKDGNADAIEKAYGGGILSVIWLLVKLGVRIVVWGSAILMWLLIFKLTTDPNAAREILGVRTHSVQHQTDAIATDGGSSSGVACDPAQVN